MKAMLTPAIVPVVMGIGTLLPGGLAEEAVASRTHRLRLTRSGAVLEVEGESPRKFSSIEEVVRAAPGAHGEFAVEEAGSGKESVLQPAAGKKGAKARIAEGEIPVLELARFLADATGLPVIHDSNDAAIAERKIIVAAAIEAASAEIVKQLLEVNRIRVREERVDGRLTLRLESTSEDGGLVEPTPHPIVVPEPGPREPAKKDRRGGPTRAAKGPGPGQQAYRGMVFAPIPEAVEAQLPKDEDRGVFIDSVEEDPAGGAPGLGVLKRFDVVTHVGDTKVASPEQLVKALGAVPPGGSVQLRLLRKGMTRILRGETRAR